MVTSWKHKGRVWWGKVRYPQICNRHSVVIIHVEITKRAILFLSWISSWVCWIRFPNSLMQMLMWHQPLVIWYPHCLKVWTKFADNSKRKKSSVMIRKRVSESSRFIVSNQFDVAVTSICLEFEDVLIRLEKEIAGLKESEGMKHTHMS